MNTQHNLTVYNIKWMLHTFKYSEVYVLALTSINSVADIFNLSICSLLIRLPLQVGFCLLYSKENSPI